MAPQPLALFGVNPNLLTRVFDVGSREAYDPQRGVKPGTLASMINRARNPDFGPQGNWLNPGQYAVLKSGGFNPNNPNIEKARAYYSTPQGQQELANIGGQLGGATDFRSTQYLKNTGNLLRYPTNLIPTVIGGTRQFVTPQQLQKLGGSPDLSENTFFNESPTRKPTEQWWLQDYIKPAETATAPATPSVLDTLSTVVNFKKPQEPQTIAQQLLEQTKANVIQKLFSPPPPVFDLPLIPGQN
jgi:hypothetical protein